MTGCLYVCLIAEMQHWPHLGVLYVLIPRGRAYAGCRREGMPMKKTGVKKSGAGKAAPTMAALKGLGVCAGLTLALCALCAMLIVNGVLPQGLNKTAGSIAATIAAFGGAMLTTRQAKQQKLLCALGMSMAYALVLLLGNLLFIEGSPAGALRIALPVLIAGILAALTGSRTRAKSPARRK